MIYRAGVKIRILCPLLLVFRLCALAESDFSNLLRWRNIGPYRGGRVRAIAGVPSQPNVFCFAPVNGGVFKTSDYGVDGSAKFRDTRGDRGFGTGPCMGPSADSDLFGPFHAVWSS